MLGTINPADGETPITSAGVSSAAGALLFIIEGTVPASSFMVKMRHLLSFSHC